MMSPPNKGRETSQKIRGRRHHKKCTFPIKRRETFILSHSKKGMEPLKISAKSSFKNDYKEGYMIKWSHSQCNDNSNYENTKRHLLCT